MVNVWSYCRYRHRGDEGSSVHFAVENLKDWDVRELCMTLLLLKIGQSCWDVIQVSVLIITNDS